MANNATPTPSPAPSPAETLRRAARDIRINATADSIDEFGLAVADWLDHQATELEQGYWGRHVDAQTVRALAVASAYLGEGE